MKNLMTVVLITFFALSAQKINAQKTILKEVKIKTSAQCEECKERIEKAMAYEKGITYSNLDVDTKVLTVKYKPKKTTPQKIRIAVSKVGYDADNVKSVERAYKALPECCQIGGMEM